MHHAKILKEGALKTDKLFVWMVNAEESEKLKASGDFFHFFYFIVLTIR